MQDSASDVFTDATESLLAEAEDQRSCTPACPPCSRYSTLSGCSAAAESMTVAACDTRAPGEGRASIRRRPPTHRRAWSSAWSEKVVSSEYSGDTKPLQRTQKSSAGTEARGRKRPQWKSTSLSLPSTANVRHSRSE